MLRLLLPSSWPTGCVHSCAMCLPSYGVPSCWLPAALLAALLPILFRLLLVLVVRRGLACQLQLASAKLAGRPLFFSFPPACCSLRLVIAASCAAPFGPLWQRFGAPSALFAATTPHHRWWQRTAGIGLGGRWWR